MRYKIWNTRWDKRYGILDMRYKIWDKKYETSWGWAGPSSAQAEIGL